MKALFIAISLLSLVAVGVIGPFAMLHGIAGHAECPIAAVAKLPCLSFGNVAQHIAGFQNLLTATPSSAVLGLLAAIFLLAALYLGALPNIARLRESVLASFTIDLPHSRLTAIRWQARLAHSPTVF